MRFLAAPTPVSSYGTVTSGQITAGEAAFNKAGCNVCHIKSMVTGNHANAALRGKTANLFSDILVHDIGTGDGRFVSTHARANPNVFYIGIDANVKPLVKPSMKATRKPARGGLPNAMFVQAAVEDLPEELNGVADRIHINFPWGSLLRAIATGDRDILQSLRRIAAPDCLLEIMIGLDPKRDKTEIERLRLPDLTSVYVHSKLISQFEIAGFDLVESRHLDRSEWSRIETSWAKKLSSSDSRSVLLFLLRAS